MPRLTAVFASAVVCLAVAGCSTQTPIIAGAADTVGLSASVGPQEQGGSFVFGYKGAKFAIVPVENRNGELLLIKDGAGKQKGFSVFAMLGADGRGGAASEVAVVQVVAVGEAAETWAKRAPVVVVRSGQ